MSLYNAHGSGHTLQVTKFDDDLNAEASYNVSDSTCDCPAGGRPTCRHRQMLPLLRRRMNTAWFWNHDYERWEDPMGTYAGEEAEALENPSPTAEPEGPQVASIAKPVREAPTYQSQPLAERAAPQVSGPASQVLGLKRRV